MMDGKNSLDFVGGCLYWGLYGRCMTTLARHAMISFITHKYFGKDR